MGHAPLVTGPTSWILPPRKTYGQQMVNVQVNVYYVILLNIYEHSSA